MVTAIWTSLGAFGEVLFNMAPYLLFGFFVAGVLSVFISQTLIERHLGGRGFAPVLKATVLGIPLPLCSCGVIPVSASLRKHGASKGATTGFLISTPQTGVDSLFVTYSLLGPVFTLFRPFAALISGLLGGALVAATDRDAAQANGAARGSCTDDCCSTTSHGKIYSALKYGFVTLPGDIARSLLIGLAAAAVITAAAPPHAFADIFGTGLGAMLVLLVLGMPFYVCATASVPVAAAMITTLGVSPGAALVFLMTGPATNGATIVTLWKVMGPRSTAMYIVAVMITALASGLLLDAIVTAGDVQVAHEHAHELFPGYETVRIASGVALLAILGVAVGGPIVKRWGGGKAHLTSESDQTLTLSVAGMTCSHCAGSVKRGLSECAGVASVEVDLSAGKVVVAGKNVDPAILCAAVTGLGYKARLAADAK